MKYIVRNCPAYQKELITMDYKTGETKVTDKHYCLNPFLPNDCTKCTDCLLKRIVENLKTCLQDNTCDNCDGVGYYDGCQDVKCGDYQARKSLELLEIEECE